MKAAVFRTMGEPLAVETLEVPKPGRDEVLLKVCCCGICGDLHMTFEPAFGISSDNVLGHGFSGEVLRLAPTPA